MPKINNVIIFLLCIFCFLNVSCTKNKIKFTRKYTPVYNPGGNAFDEDVQFAKKYKIYKKHRDIIENKTSKSTKNPDKSETLTEESIISQLNTSGVALVNSQPVDNANNNTFNTGNNLINSDGIDLSKIKGAKFIEVDDSNWGPLPQKKESHLFTQSISPKNNSNFTNDFSADSDLDDYSFSLEDQYENSFPINVKQANTKTTLQQNSNSNSLEQQKLIINNRISKLINKKKGEKETSLVKDSINKNHDSSIKSKSPSVDYLNDDSFESYDLE